MARENDIVLIYFEDKPMTFARIEDIRADHKPDWYHVKLLLLQMPLQPVTWILRTAYIDGAEFTMNGNRMRLELVVCPAENAEPENTEPENAEKDAGKELPDGDKSDHNGTDHSGSDHNGSGHHEKETKVISFRDLKKR